jgi:hypothetical protein
MKDIEILQQKTKYRQNMLMGRQRRMGKAFHELIHTGGK